MRIKSNFKSGLNFRTGSEGVLFVPIILKKGRKKVECDKILFDAELSDLQREETYLWETFEATETLSAATHFSLLFYYLCSFIEACV